MCQAPAALLRACYVATCGRAPIADTHTYVFECIGSAALSNEIAWFDALHPPGGLAVSSCFWPCVISLSEVVAAHILAATPSRHQPSSTMRHGHHKVNEAKRECDGTHLAPSAMSTFFVEYPCVPHVCVPLHCSWELLFALRSQNMAAGIDDSIAELTWPSWLGCLAGRLAGWLAGWLVSLS